MFYACPSLKSPVGLCYMDTRSAEGLGFLRNPSSHFPGLCRLVLTFSHDSLFLRYPAVDIVWRGPVSLALGFLRPLALRWSALVVSKSWLVQYPVLLPDVSSALPDFDTSIDSCHTPPVVLALASNPNGEFVSVLCLRSLCFYSVIIAHPAIRVNDWNRAN